MRMTQRLGWPLVPVVALAFLSAVPLRASADRRARANGPARTTATKTTITTPPSPAGGTRLGSPVDAPKTSILGAAWNVDNAPIPQATLRLRDVVTGRAVAVSRANDAGQFAFENIEGGSYVVELLNDAGKVQAIGHIFTIAPGETVATFVRLEAKVPWAVAFFTNTANAVASAAASQGITALAPLGRCVSPPGCSH
jgi:hypothetical protein